MSVMNKMLQDLQARQGGGVVATEDVRATAAAPKRNRMLLLLLGGAAAISAAAFAPLPSPGRAPSVPAAVLADAAPTPVANTPAVADAERPASAPSVEHALRMPANLPRAPVPARVAATPPSVTAPAPAPAPATTAATAMASTITAAALIAPAPASAALPRLPPLPPLTLPAGKVERTAAVQSPAQRAQALYRQGLELVSSGHAGSGADKLAQALQLDPALHDARLTLAGLMLEQGRGAETETLAQEGLQARAADPQLSYLLARALADRGDAAGAIDKLGGARALGPDALGLRAGLRAQQGDFKQALVDYEAAVRTQPGNSLWWLGLGVALEAQGRGVQARQAYAKAQGLGLPREELAAFIEQKLATP